MVRDLLSVSNLQADITETLLRVHGAGVAAQGAYAACDKVQEDALAAKPRPKPACVSGCSHCCRNPISATVPEVLVVAQSVRDTMPDDERTALIERLKRPDVTCALLVQNRCRVYDSRPLACRGCVSLSRLSCAKSFGKSGSIPTRSDLFNLSTAIQVGLQQGLHRANFPHRPVLFNPALLIALSIDDAEARWASGDSVFDSALVPISA